ncbi:aspartate-semialdehyde dehydrogenase [Clavulina sp. PMI_390]|nr:aspartate-semialdehyde dehydrogenase [Clavulina sp. PMI_390]
MVHLDSLKEVPVGVLGATGTVGQRFIKLLAVHPVFKLVALGASKRSSGQPYSKAVAGRWKQVAPVPANVRDIIVQECLAEHFADCKVVFSGLDSDVAGDIELAFRKAELAVFSNAKNHRRDPQTPLIVPLVNPSHLSIIPYQRSIQSPPLQKGFIVTNANCSTTGLVVPLAALEQKYGPLEAVMATTMQAISGAGYPGVPSMDIMDNMVPYISGEEEKMEWETAKILGGIATSESNVQSFDLHADAPMRISAQCTRVPVIEGHTEAVSIRFARRPPPSPQQVRETLEAFTCEAQTLHVPSAPMHAIKVHEDEDRPQPRLDRDFEEGAGVHVGRIRQCPVMDIKFVLMVNNVALGAATSSIINAEVAIAKDVVVL